ncbi:unnamed protein product [Agarophyton chilense]
MRAPAESQAAACIRRSFLKVAVTVGARVPSFWKSLVPAARAASTTAHPSAPPFFPRSIDIPASHRGCRRAMPNCDVCLGEARDVGVLRCNHSVCRACGVSQSSCLVCNDVGGTKRRRFATTRFNPRSHRPNTPTKPAAAERIKLRPRQHRSSSDQSAAFRSVQTSEARLKSVPTLEPHRQAAPGRSTTPESDQPEPPLKYRKIVNGRRTSKTDADALSSESKNGMRRVQGPTAFDEVRCELRPLGSAPKIQRCALRTTGRLPVYLVARYIRERLELPLAEQVIIKCSDEELTDDMTLGDLISHVWPASEGHLILDYEVPNYDAN